MNLQSARRKLFIRRMSAAKSWSRWSLLYVDVPEEFAGTVIQKLSLRKGELQGMSTGQRRLHPSGVLPFPSRGLIGYRGDFMT